MDRRLVERLRAVVGDAGLVADPTLLLPYESDGLALLRPVLAAADAAED
mgnify:CR=1 FL=1